MKVDQCGAQLFDARNVRGGREILLRDNDVVIPVNQHFDASDAFISRWMASSSGFVGQLMVVVPSYSNLANAGTWAGSVANT